MQLFEPSDLLTLCDGQECCSSLTTPPRSKKDMQNNRMNDNPYYLICSICRNNCIVRQPDSDKVLNGELSGQEMFPKIEHYVTNSTSSGDTANRYLKAVYCLMFNFR